MIAVAIASDAIMAKLEENRARLAKLADPRTINMDDAQAETLVDASTPIYYITGTIHSPETGAPTALMELAYRLVVDDHEYIKSIRNNLITLITPVVEVDGRDKMVDVYKWHLAQPGPELPGLVYWGKYVAHDNNRDAMGADAEADRERAQHLCQWHPQVLHDLHESVPYLYDNTVGDGPYNAWIDPILADEWEMIGWNNVSEMTKFGMPGVFTHGNFDTWSPGYLMFIAALHNGISRLYETFGNGGADTVERELRPDEYARTWYKQNPPLPKTMWSQRNNNNYEQTGLLTSLHYFAGNGKLFLRNFYLKSKRSILKAKTEGPAAYVLPGRRSAPGRAGGTAAGAAEAGRRDLARDGGVHGHGARQARPGARRTRRRRTGARGSGRAAECRQAGQDGQDRRDAGRRTEHAAGAGDPHLPRRLVHRPHGSAVQPHRRLADGLPGPGAPNDPQKTPYDDTGWTFPELFNVQAVRVADVKVLDAAMEKVTGDCPRKGGVTGTGIGVPRQPQRRRRAGDAALQVQGRVVRGGGGAVRGGGQEVQPRLVHHPERRRPTSSRRRRPISACRSSRCRRRAVGEDAPGCARRASRCCTPGSSTQTEGWWRQAFDTRRCRSPTSARSRSRRTRTSTRSTTSSSFRRSAAAPRASSTACRCGATRCRGRRPRETPNLGSEDQTDDMRPGLGWTGVAHLQDVRAQRRAAPDGRWTPPNFAVTNGFTPGAVGRRAPAAAHRRQRRALEDGRRDQPDRVRLHRQPVDLWCDNGPIFNVANMFGARGGRRLGPDDGGNRPTGRGTADDPDTPQGRTGVEAAREEPRSTRGRRCRSPTSSCATAST